MKERWGGEAAGASQEGTSQEVLVERVLSPSVRIQRCTVPYASKQQEPSVRVWRQPRKAARTVTFSWSSEPHQQLVTARLRSALASFMNCQHVWKQTVVKVIYRQKRFQFKQTYTLFLSDVVREIHIGTCGTRRLVQERSLGSELFPVHAALYEYDSSFV